jgi:hypothetical protein
MLALRRHHCSNNRRTTSAILEQRGSVSNNVTIVTHADSGISPLGSKKVG